MPRGGFRPNAKGPAKGAKYKPTLSKEAAREALRVIVMQHMAEMSEAQISAAKGLKYLMTRDATGKFVKVTAAMAGALDGTEIIEVWEEKPSTPAFTDLMNRALDKPAEQEQAVKIGGTLVLKHEL